MLWRIGRLSLVGVSGIGELVRSRREGVVYSVIGAVAGRPRDCRLMRRGRS